MRMSRADRTDLALRVLQDKYAKAASQSDFTAKILAAANGISVVWFYILVGKEYRRLRSSLPGGIPPETTVIGRLRERVKSLEAELKELKDRYKVSLRDKIAEAIRHIELLDKENRALRERVAQLEKSLKAVSAPLD
jgi:FtsZ-binding cell division protein ZapB